jgi:hypothetical protein
MDENPYETPLSSTIGRREYGVTLTAHLRDVREAHRRWSRYCWLFGGSAIFLGLLGYTVSQGIYAEYRTGWLVALIDIAATCLIAAGCLLIAFGPIAWFWVRRRR